MGVGGSAGTPTGESSLPGAARWRRSLRSERGSRERVAEFAVEMVEAPGPEMKVWSPSLDAAPLPAAALEVKLGSVVTVLLLPLISGLAALHIFRRFGGLDSSGSRRRTMSLISCFSCGVFLATCLLDLVPDYLSGINDALRKLNIMLQFPLQMFILTMGFFLVLALEQIVLSFMDSSTSSEDKRALLGSSLDGRSDTDFDNHWRPDLPHMHMDVNSHSAVRAVVLVLSLSLHSLLEGLELGLQREGGKALQTCAALLLHKCLISFCITLKLVQGRMRARAVLGCIVCFSFMLPLGIVLSLARMDIGDPVQQLSRSVMEGIATGTFVYVTFLEILPHEISSPEHRIPKLIVMLLGLSVISGILFMKI